MEEEEEEEKAGRGHPNLLRATWAAAWGCLLGQNLTGSRGF